MLMKRENWKFFFPLKLCLRVQVRCTQSLQFIVSIRREIETIDKTFTCKKKHHSEFDSVSQRFHKMILDKNWVNFCETYILLNLCLILECNAESYPHQQHNIARRNNRKSEKKNTILPQVRTRDRNLIT